jgi:alpha-ribazole phosphatase
LFTHKPVQLHLIRHPEPAIDAGICYGSSDVPAKHAALQDCLSTLLPTLKPLNGAPIYTSPLIRCAALAQFIANALPASRLRVCPELAELDFGAWEGRHWDAIYATDAPALDAWAADPFHYAPGGGETLAQLHARVTLWLENLFASKAEQAIVVTHGGPLRVLLNISSIRAGVALDAVLNTKAPLWGSLSVQVVQS